MRVYVYVDGFNFYYRALKDTPFKWLNLHSLATRLLRPGDQVEAIRYFTARVSPRAGNPGAPRRQQILLSALATLPNFHVHYGRFLPKTKRRPLVSNPAQFVEILDTEEKGLDVNLAVHLVNDGWRKRYDLALVISQDTDLIEPIRIVAKELGIPVGLVWSQGQPNPQMKAAATFVRHVRRSDLTLSLFPDPIVTPTGRIHKPAGW
ncbi:MAG: NYN domain-containing protein [Parvibaculaceae bacterium]